METPSGFLTNLMFYQKQGLYWMVEHEKYVPGRPRGGVLADEMGLGKTVIYPFSLLISL